IEVWRGKARFVEPLAVEVRDVGGTSRRADAKNVVIAVGAVPRTHPGTPIDHEHVLDSDSILSMRYLPASLAVLGAGVIASEYASIFAALGVKVTMIDQGPRPLGFLDPELTDRFVARLEGTGGRFVGNAKVTK